MRARAAEGRICVFSETKSCIQGGCGEAEPPSPLARERDKAPAKFTGGGMGGGGARSSGHSQVSAYGYWVGGREAASGRLARHRSVVLVALRSG